MDETFVPPIDDPTLPPVVMPLKMGSTIKAKGPGG